MIVNEFRGLIIQTTCAMLDKISQLGVCGTRDGAVLIWSQGIVEDADEHLSKVLVESFPDLFSIVDGELEYKDAEDTMLYFVC